jgi:hypothetical protein
MDRKEVGLTAGHRFLAEESARSWMLIRTAAPTTQAWHVGSCARAQGRINISLHQGSVIALTDADGVVTNFVAV